MLDQLTRAKVISLSFVNNYVQNRVWYHKAKNLYAKHKCPCGGGCEVTLSNSPCFLPFRSRAPSGGEVEGEIQR